jgi:hypothetical protein
LTTDYKISFDISQPIACIGRYSSCVSYLLRREGEYILSSKSLWIDYRVIPLFLFYSARNTVKTEFYFIECTSTEDISIIIESRELFNLKSYDFSSIVLNYPSYISKRLELSNILNQIASLLKVVIITSDSDFPIAESQKIRVDGK